MHSLSRQERIERSRPLLGTLVNISCCGQTPERAHRAIDAAFDAIGEVHRLMSFHEATSDVTRLNQNAASDPVEVDQRTFAVLTLALDMAEASCGAFDISIGQRLVAGGRLPRPPSAPDPDPAASWRDIELLPDRRVRFRRPLWIDLGGIAKGFAVDCAIDRVADDPSVRWVVNAGGDLRVAGDGAEQVLLQTELPGEELAPVIELENASLASSSSRGQARYAGGNAIASHVDGRTGRPVGTRSFVSVVAQECAVADGLTKVVLALRARATRVLRRYGATAFLQDHRGAWRQLGCGA